jgi:hypothetical protein
VVITSSEGVGELRWVMGRPVIPAAREVLQTAANALDVKLEMSESLDNIVADFANTPQHSKND